MSIVVSIRFISGRVHATPWGNSHNEGAVEFPPSPWRLQRALVATWFERAPEIPETVVRSVVGSLSTCHPTYWVPPMAGAHKRHYFPDSDHREGVGKASTAKVLDTFASVDAELPVCVKWEIELAPTERAALRRLVELLPYLGRAESMVEARLCDDNDPDPVADQYVRIEPGYPSTASQPQLRLLSSGPTSTFEDLLAVPWKLRSKGFVTPPSSQPAPYFADRSIERVSRPPMRFVRPDVSLLQWQLVGKGRIPATSAVAYCEILRWSILDQVRKQFPDVGWELTGKENGSATERGNQHAYFLPVVHDGFLVGLSAWFPTPIPDRVAQVAAGIQRLWFNDRDGLRDFRPVRLFLSAVEPVVSNAKPSSTWDTVTPYAPIRHLRSDNRFDRSLLQEVCRDLSERGNLGSLLVSVMPLNRESASADRHHPLDYRRHRIDEQLSEARRAFHLRLTFCEPVDGPISLGALSHFGLGSFEPTFATVRL